MQPLPLHDSVVADCCATALCRRSTCHAFHVTTTPVAAPRSDAIAEHNCHGGYTNSLIAAPSVVNGADGRAAATALQRPHPKRRAHLAAAVVATTSSRSSLLLASLSRTTTLAHAIEGHQPFVRQPLSRES